MTLWASGAFAQATVTGYEEITSVNQLGSGTISIDDGGHLRVLASGTLAGPVEFVNYATTTLSTTGSLTVNVERVGYDTNVNLGLAGQGGTIILNNFGTVGQSPAGTLSVNGGTTVVSTAQAVTGLWSLRSITVASGAVLDYGVKSLVLVNGLNGGGLIGGAIGNMIVSGGSFSGTIEGANTLHFLRTTTWSGTGQDIGRVVVDSGAALTTSGGNVFQDSTALQVDGSLDLQSSETTGALSGSGTITVANGQTLTSGADNTSSNWNGTIDGLGGSFTKTGTGTLTITGQNYYEGATTIAGGTLVISGGLAIADASAVTVNTGATLQVNTSENVGSISGGGTIVLNNTILGAGYDNSSTAFFGNMSGSGQLLKRGSGTLTLFGTNTNTGGIDAIGGSVVLAGGNAMSDTAELALNGGSAELQTSEAIGSLSGSGGVNINANTLTLAGSASTTYSGAISGTGTIARSGSGTLTLTGNSSGFAGTTTVDGSALVLNGQLGGSATIGNGGRLSGTGTIGSGAGSLLTMASGSSVGPGNSIGTLHVNGNMVFNSGSRYEVEVDPNGTGSDLIAATGTVTINGGSVVHIGAAGNYKPTQTYTILTADQGVFGTFDPNSVTSDFAFLNALLAYGTNDITLTLQRNDIAFGQLGRTRNQIATATGIDGLTFGNGVFDAVVALDAATAPSAFDQLSGEIHASTTTGLIEDSRFIRDAANQRLRAAFDSVDASSAPIATHDLAGAASMPLASGDGPALWSSGFGDGGRASSDGNAASLSRHTVGMVAGADGMLGDWRVGILGGYGQSGVSVDDRGSSESSDNYTVGLYGGTRWKGVALRTGIAQTWSEIDTRRNVAFPGFADRLSADYSDQTLQAFAELGYAIDTDVARFEPFVNLAHVNVRTEGFTESGGAAALTSASRTTDTTFATLGIRAEKGVTLGDTRVNLHGMAGWLQAFGDTTPTASHAFAGSSAFTIAGSSIDRSSALIEAGLDLKLTPDATFGLAAQGQLGSGAQDLGLKANLAVSF
ncbi:autotransporter outer membrane beta-barrel domain-containing protein [Pleomorphomonas oryzae]|uniref:autotransporter outer membrane beta-barrel domain-containing protein n=1 Tax=Pleomorphomonas oryzae TaxID=261934 RepID=UPI00146D0C7F|nr:autotransporter domain-containing protein [Pleomorphomonas oryzae]